ncbi:plasmid replication initiator RepA, partial [Citrobacter freundii]|nr:replication initiation protein [Citrobacter freundii]ELJ9995357.1 replication initiation protein [Citrobacter freundii]
MHHRKQHPKGVSDIPLSVHWSELPEDEQIRFWQEVDAGTQDDFLLTPAKKQTRRTRGDHSTKAKCEFPVWYRPAHY